MDNLDPMEQISDLIRNGLLNGSSPIYQSLVEPVVKQLDEQRRREWFTPPAFASCEEADVWLEVRRDYPLLGLMLAG